MKSTCWNREAQMRAVRTKMLDAGAVIACAACYGKSDSPLAYGMNWGIFTLLGILAPVLGCFAFCFIRMIRREESAHKQNSAPKNIADL